MRRRDLASWGLGLWILVSAGPGSASGPDMAASSGAPVEAAPAAVHLRTAALLLSDQEGGELVMVASAVRRVHDGRAVAQVVIEVDGASLRRALPAGGDVEAYVYLADARREVHDSVTASWTVPAPPGREEAPSAAAAGYGEASLTPAETGEVDPAPIEEEAVEEEPESEHGLPAVQPVRFETELSLPASGPLRIRALLRAGDHFGLRSVDIEVPNADDVVPTLLEPRFSAEGPAWQRIAPAGRGLNVSSAALPLLRRGETVDIQFVQLGGPSSSGAVTAATSATVELEIDGATQELEIQALREGGHGELTGRIELPSDLEEGRYRARLRSSEARPSAPVDVLILDPSHGPLRWTELAELKPLEETFEAEALEMPRTERERIDATRKALFEVVAELERGDAAALARLRALEVSLHEVLEHDSVPFLEKQLGRVLGQMLKRSRKEPDSVLPLIWLFMEHGDRHDRKGRYRYFRLSLDLVMEMARWCVEQSPSSRDGAVGSMAVLAGRMQRRSMIQPAEELLREALDHAPDRIELLSALAAIYERHGRPGEAVPLLQRWTELEPDRPAAWTRLAIAQQRTEAWDDAARNLGRVLSFKDPKHADWRTLAYQQGIRLAVDRGDLGAAAKIVAAGRKDVASDPVLRVAEVWLAGLQGDASGARSGAAKLPTSREPDDVRHRFHAWPRRDLDTVEEELRRRVDERRSRVSALARKAMEDLF